MDNSMRYQRVFLFFEHEDTGYGFKQEPSGHAKIEVKDGKGVLSVNVQNLKEDAGIGYRVYILKAGVDGILPVCAGNIKLCGSRGELYWNFSPDNVGGTGNPIDSFNVIAVICDFKNLSKKRLVCPLAAYRAKKAEWRNYAEQQLFPISQTLPSSIKVGMGSKPSEAANKEAPMAEPVKAVEKAEALKPAKTGEETVKAEVEEQPKAAEAAVKGKAPEQANTASIEAKTQDPQLSKKGEAEEKTEAVKEEETAKPAEIPGNTANINNEEEHTGYDKEAQMPDTALPEGCLLKNYSEMDSTFCQDAYGNHLNPCEGCSAMCMPGISKEEAEGKQGNMRSMVELRKTLSKYFESSDPFKSRRKDYQWWKAASAVQLNNILCQFDLRTQLLYNSKALTAHFKYRHLIVGIYSDRITRLDYIVCGIPGVYGIDAKPFGEYCRWVQVEGNVPKYGAFGYWLIYINPRSGEMLRIG